MLDDEPLPVGIAALEGSQDFIQEMLQAFAQSRKLMLGYLNEMPGITCAEPNGAFYLLPNIKRTGMKSIEFLKRC